MTITRADALEVMTIVAACHPRTAPRWHDDPQAANVTADTWARMFNRHNLPKHDLVAAVEQRAADTADTAPEPGEIIQHARRIRNERASREQANPEARARHEARLDERIEHFAAAFGLNARPTEHAIAAPTRPVQPDPDRMAQARAELDTIRHNR